MPSGDVPRKGRARRLRRPCPARRRPTRGRGSTSHEGRPRCLPHRTRWTGPTRPSRPCASYGARATRRPRSAAAWTPPRTRSWARPIACSCRRGRHRSGLRRLIARSRLHASPRQSWQLPASCRLPSCQHRLLSRLPSIPRAPAPARRAGTCQWPIGEPGRAGFHLCGDGPAPGKPYCPSHCGRAYVRPRIAVDAFAAS